MVWPRFINSTIFVVIRTFLATLFSLVLFSVVHADPPNPDQQRLRGPAVRVAENRSETPVLQNHPLVPLLHAAKKSLEHSRNNIHDYSTTLVKRELVGGVLLDHQFIRMKVRNERKDAAGRIKAPFSVYLNFLGPEDVKGREVLWVKGENKGHLYAHEGSGLVGLFSVWLDPDGDMAMRGQRYPIYQIGIENLLTELIQRTEQDVQERPPEDFDLQVIEGARIDKRSCTCYQVKHPVRKSHYEFFSARIFVDDEYDIPIRYVAWGWPERANTEPPIIEEYTYTDLKLNPRYTRHDFDPRNKQYNF